MVRFHHEARHQGATKQRARGAFGRELGVRRGRTEPVEARRLVIVRILLPVATVSLVERLHMVLAERPERYDGRAHLLGAPILFDSEVARQAARPEPCVARQALVGAVTHADDDAKPVVRRRLLDNLVDLAHQLGHIASELVDCVDDE